MKKSASYFVEKGDQEILRTMDLLDLVEDSSQNKRDRQMAGRYRLIEAAEAIIRGDANAPFRVIRPDLAPRADTTGETLEELAEVELRASAEVVKLITAAATGDLPVFLPGRNERHQSTERAGRYHEETYWKYLNAWLDKNELDIAFRFPAPAGTVQSSASGVVPKTIPLQRQQEQEILQVIAELGYIATALPPRNAGKEWVKAEVRKRIPERSQTKEVFRKAWKRLKETHEIVESQNRGMGHLGMGQTGP
ncbi:hypothetical protein [Castellaniella sp.]|uniref:hypothetical protein n=1 Tax=Castellaniella sp. TaxID=1955812 RepID=UPI003A93DAED